MPPREPLFERDVWSLFDFSWAPDSSGLDNYLRALLKRCARWFDASSASIFLKEGSGDYVLAAKTGTGGRIPAGARFRRGEGIAGASMESGEPLLVSDPRENALLAGKVRARRDLGSSMIVPLATPESGCVGVVNLARRKGARQFTDRDLRQAKSIAGHIALAVGNARLFSQMEEATARARGMHEKLGAVIDRLGVGVLVVDASGQVTECNPEAAAMVGVDPDGRSRWSEFARTASESMAGPVDEVVAGALAGVATSRRAYDRDADRAWALTGTPMPDGGATLAIHEITEFERAQRELEGVKRLAEIGQMTAAIAHEIRNPLTGIRSAAQFIRQDATCAEEFASIIESEAIKLNGLCDEFLEFAKPPSLEVRDVSISQIVRHVASLHRRDFESAGVRIEVEIPDREPIIKGDPSRVEQICRNLVLNAIQACGRGGTVRVSVHEEGFSVADDGVGMHESTRERLFTPFFTTRASGTGLGLSTVRKIVDAHGGSIDVETEPGKGTTFHVRLAQRKVA